MKNFHLPQFQLQVLHGRILKGVLSANNTLLTGVLGSRLLRARAGLTDFTVSLSLRCPIAHVMSLCLALSSAPEACDEAIYYNSDSLWLVKRYSLPLNEIELVALIKQQQTLAALLDSVGDRSRSSGVSFTGRFA